MRWADPAARDLSNIADWIAQDSVASARRVRHMIRTRVQQLEHMPHAGRPGRIAETRELVVVGLPTSLPMSVGRARS
ncbi:type II toxin-antitoxin system mRNA interferase toxin, RelE/StbE family [Prosthecomicrobium hirschii]|uniref:type II toxin-antitoxin system RelE/ParE family toxin n=1 Tax=Prosthecodimorpha hirschii TaxID=665126 RepID=UPI001DF43252|nr:type II toxin-antitoxin system mRNA interferase toxin, RelE/StbE family [Prosthecomicrobium hirschii]